MIICMALNCSVYLISWIITFLTITIVAAIFAFGGIVAAAMAVAKIIFSIFLTLLVISLIIGFIRGF